MDYTCHYRSPFGDITLASDGEVLIGLWFDGQKHFGDVLKKEHKEEKLPVFEETIHWLDLYFQGQIPSFTPKLALRGTLFQQKVWQLLLEIPYGQTTTYRQIAQKIDEKGKMSCQAIGNAVSHNPISIIVPCHRVIGSDGSLTGYAGGLERKRKLLELEKDRIDIRQRL
ncbi:MAG: methylated-DNA--[Erysipelotrichaceae bacterium]|nr:methylated-DNA--[protein]-cysteine S-methyltransferase [Erysipelotrichaceae bacterium]